jgi:hypothetical protein
VNQLIRAFAQQVRHVHHARQDAGIAKSISIENIANLAEPAFADSAHSTLLQLTDLVSHLLLQLEREDLEPSASPSPYRTEVIRLARGLDPALLHCWKEKLRIQRASDKPAESAAASNPAIDRESVCTGGADAKPAL